MTLHVATLGNIAQNAYLLARFLRRLGVEADSYDAGGGNSMWVPWWEDASFDESEIGPHYWAWSRVAAKTGVERPSWAKIMGNDAAEAWYDTQEAYEADLGRLMAGYQRTVVPEPRQRREVMAALRRSRLSTEEQKALVEPAISLLSWRSMIAIARQYDLVVLCGPLAGYAPVFPADIPYITFEHATMRSVPRLDTGDQRLIAAAYQHADWNIITNADCREAAWMLGLEKFSFIPHPFDEEKFSPGDDVFGAKIREALGVDLLIYIPSRHSFNESSGTKRSDRAVYAFARYVREAEPKGAPRAALLLSAWGEHAKLVEQLTERLGINDRVKWLQSMPKPKVLRMLRAADIVMDQFSESVGSFGTTTIEALSVGKPVITYINAERHEWCLSSIPPVCNALTADQIYQWLVYLALNPEHRAQYGRDGRAWVLEHHGWRRVAEEHLELYERVLAGKGRSNGRVSVVEQEAQHVEMPVPV